MPSRLSWLLFIMLAAFISASVLTYDFRSHPKVTGDQSSHLLQALSLAYDGDLKFDDGDLARWRDLGWEDIPNGLFYQRYHDGFAFAKPYIYSVWLAPFIRVAGAVHGLALANWFTLALVVGVSAALLLRRFSGPAVPLLLSAFYFTSYFYLYAFVIEPAPFHALIVVCFIWLMLRFLDTKRPGALLACAPVMALALAEKVSLGLLLGPLFLYGLFSQREAPRWRCIGLFAVSYFLVLLPYLHYSDWQSLTPYGGHRYYCYNRVPFTEVVENVQTRQHNTTNKAAELVRATLNDPGRIAVCVYYYFFGSFTGVAVFAPAVFLVLAASLLKPPAGNRGAFSALLVGVALAILGYILIYPENYYGGGQAVGNRWFLKMIPAILALGICSRLSGQALARIAGVSFLASALFLNREHWRHRDAFANPTLVSNLRRYFSLEVNQAMLPPNTGGLRVNLRLYPRKPVWRYVADVEPPLWEWVDGSFQPARAEKHGKFVYAVVRLGPMFYRLPGQDGIYVADTRVQDGGAWFRSINGWLSVTAQGGATHHLHLWSEQDANSLMVVRDAKTETFPLPCVLTFRGGEAGGQLMRLYSGKEFAGAFDEPEAAQRLGIPEFALDQ